MPHGYCKITNLIANLRRIGMVAPVVLDRSSNHDGIYAQCGCWFRP